MMLMIAGITGTEWMKKMALDMNMQSIRRSTETMFSHAAPGHAHHVSLMPSQQQLQQLSQGSFLLDQSLFLPPPPPPPLPGDHTAFPPTPVVSVEERAAVV